VLRKHRRINPSAYPGPKPGVCSGLIQSGASDSVLQDGVWRRRSIKQRGVFFQALVTLYEAMGGGWVLEADHLAGKTIYSKISSHGSEVLHANQ